MDTQEGTETKKKRTTIADLEKRVKKLEEDIAKRLGPLSDNIDNHLDELETAINNTVLEEMASLASRIEALEKGTAILQGNQSTLTNQYLEQQKRLDEEKPDGAVTNVTDRLTALENVNSAVADAVRTIGEGTAEWGSRMEDAEDSIHSLQAALTDTQESATHTGPVPLPRPIPEPGGRIDPDALKAVAQTSQTMSDVLHMTRFLKVASDITDQERREIMSIACKAAGVPYAENLLVRAGVRSFEA